METVIIFSILFCLSIVLNIFQYFNNQSTTARMINAIAEDTADKIISPKIWPCEMIFVQVCFNMQEDSQVVDFSQYKEIGIISFKITVKRAPTNPEEEKMDGEVMIISPGAVYSPVEGVFTWITQP